MLDYPSTRRSSKWTQPLLPLRRLDAKNPNQRKNQTFEARMAAELGEPHSSVLISPLLANPLETCLPSRHPKTHGFRQSFPVPSLPSRDVWRSVLAGRSRDADMNPGGGYVHVWQRVRVKSLVPGAPPASPSAWHGARSAGVRILRTGGLVALYSGSMDRCPLVAKRTGTDKIQTIQGVFR